MFIKKNDEENINENINTIAEIEKKPEYLSDEVWQFVQGTEKILNEYIPLPSQESDEYKDYRKMGEYFFSDIIMTRLSLTKQENRDEYISKHEDSVGAIDSVVSNIGLEPNIVAELQSRLKDVSTEDVKQIAPFFEKFNDDNAYGEYEVLTDKIYKIINDTEPASIARSYLDVKRDGKI